MTMRVIRVVLIMFASALLAFALTAARSYHTDLTAARLNALAGSQVISTARGPIEFATRGAGPTVLALHGTGGGWDQGMYLAGVLADNGFRVIAPSRFGYLRTPPPTHM